MGSWKKKRPPKFAGNPQSVPKFPSRPASFVPSTIDQSLIRNSILRERGPLFRWRMRWSHRNRGRKRRSHRVRRGVGFQIFHEIRTNALYDRRRISPMKRSEKRLYIVRMKQKIIVVRRLLTIHIHVVKRLMHEIMKTQQPRRWVANSLLAANITNDVFINKP